MRIVRLDLLLLVGCTLTGLILWQISLFELYATYFPFNGSFAGSNWFDHEDW